MQNMFFKPKHPLINTYNLKKQKLNVIEVLSNLADIGGGIFLFDLAS